MRPRSLLFLASSLGLLLAAAPAHAQGCPEGDWFCEPAEPPSPEPAPAPESAPTPAEPSAPAPPPPAPRWRGSLLPDEPPPPPRRRRARRELGFDIHLLGSFIGGEDAHPDAGMGGFGFGLRYRPIPHFALDGSLELAYGTDYNGYERTEAALLANAVGFFNPRHRLQLYVLAGLGVSAADVSRPVNPWMRHGDRHYTYFGMQLGGGLEGRISRRTALRFDVVGFVRGRTDDDLRSDPEFVDPETQRVTNTSGGALLRGGAIFYW